MGFVGTPDKILDQPDEILISINIVIEKMLLSNAGHNIKPANMCRHMDI